MPPKQAEQDASSEARVPLIQVVGLSKTFWHGGRKLEVLRDLNLTLFAGEMLSVVGMSGAGKSTFLHVLGTIDTPTQGSILFCGNDLAQMSAAQLASFRNRFIGFVFQFHHLLPEFTALENVMMPALVQRLPLREAQERAAEMLISVGLAERLTHKPGQLSGGEQQRVALARALVMKPRLLLADEPTGNLDRKTGESIHELFFRLNKQFGTTMLIVTHNNELASRLPRKLRMVDGILEEEGVAVSPAAPPAGASKTARGES